MTKLNPISYYWNNCILQGWSNVRYAFDTWSLLMTTNYYHYDIMDNSLYPYTQEEKQEAIYTDFWESLEDDIYPKEFIEYLLGICEEIHNGNVELVPFTTENGNVELVPFTTKMFDELTNLVTGDES